MKGQPLMVRILLCLTCLAGIAYWIVYGLAFGPSTIVAAHAQAIELVGMSSFVALVSFALLLILVDRRGNRS